MSVDKAVADSFKGKSERGFLYTLAPDFPAFAGHFEGHPVLPAVCQMSLCAHAAGQFLATAVQIAALSRAKFVKPVVPGTQIAVSLTARGENSFMAELSDAQTGEKISQLIFSITRKEQL